MPGFFYLYFEDIQAGSFIIVYLFRFFPKQYIFYTRTLYRQPLTQNKTLPTHSIKYNLAIF